MKPPEEEGELDRNSSLLQGHRDEPSREQNTGWELFPGDAEIENGDFGHLWARWKKFKNHLGCFVLFQTFQTQEWSGLSYLEVRTVTRG